MSSQVTLRQTSADAVSNLSFMFYESFGLEGLVFGGLGFEGLGLEGFAP